MPIVRLVGQVEALSASGFGVALDHVGSGNAGLEMMRALRFDYVKIDRSVILDAANRGPGRAIIAAIATYARASNTFMIAEGVETVEMLNSISFGDGDSQDYGVQGFLFGRPSESIASVTKRWPLRLEGKAA